MTVAASLTARNDVVREVIELLAAKQYRELQLLDRGARFTELQIETAVREYGRTLIPLPTDGMALIDYVPIKDAAVTAWSTYVPLFTQEEGRSDLTLDLTVFETSEGVFEIELNGLRVL